MRHFDFVVVGAGAMGSATAYRLAKKEKSVLLIEQFEVGHENGSSHGNSRIFRLAYGHPTYVALAGSAMELWRELEGDCGKQVLDTTGGLDLGSEDNQELQERMASLAANGVKYQQLSASQVREKFPQWSIGDREIGLYQSDAGILDASLCVKKMVETAIRFGCSFMDNCEVLSIKGDGNKAEVVTPTETITADKVIVTAGAWAGPLMEQMGLKLDLQVVKEQYLFFKPLKPDIFRKGSFPIFIDYGIDLAKDVVIYGFPMHEMQAVKIASHRTGLPTTAETRNFDLEEGPIQIVRNYIEKRLPLLNGEMVPGKTCLYTNTSDHEFIIDWVPGKESVLLVSSCSGHGFKFASVIGEIACNLATERKTQYPIDMFRVDRFAQSQAEACR